MKRVVVDHFGGPEVLRVVEEDDPRPGPGEVRVRVLAAGVSFTDALIRARTYLGGPKPPFTPAYELVGRGRGARPGLLEAARGRPRRRADGVGRRRGARLRAGGVRGRGARGPRPGGGRELVFPYMTAYQMLHRTARVKTGETVLVHGAAGRVGTAALELGALAGLRLIGTASARDRAAVERLGAAGDWRLGRSAGVTGAGTQTSAIVDGSERELIVLQGARWSSQAGVSVSKRKCSLNARSASDLEHHGRCTGSCT